MIERSRVRVPAGEFSSQVVGGERESMCACETKRGAEREGEKGGGGGACALCVCFSVVIILIT